MPLSPDRRVLKGVYEVCAAHQLCDGTRSEPPNTTQSCLTTKVLCHTPVQRQMACPSAVRGTVGKLAHYLEAGVYVILGYRSCILCSLPGHAVPQQAHTNSQIDLVSCHGLQSGSTLWPLHYSQRQMCWNRTVSVSEWMTQTRLTGY